MFELLELHIEGVSIYTSVICFIASRWICSTWISIIILTHHLVIWDRSWLFFW